MHLSPFTKDFRGGHLLRVICIFGVSAHSRATLEFQKQSEFDCLPTCSGRKCSWSIVSTFSLCGPCVTPSYLFSQRGKTELFYMWWDPNPGHDLCRVGPKQRSLQLLKAYQRLMRFEFEHFYWLCKPASTKCIGGIVASIAVFQAVDPASIPGQRISLGSGWSRCGTVFVTSGETFGWVVRQQKITSSPRLGIEPRSSAWQAEILSTILTRSCACRDLPQANDTALRSLNKACLFPILAQPLNQ